MNYHIRWLIRRDMPAVMAIENASFEHPWLESDYIKALHQRNCIGMVCECEEQAVGFMIYRLHPRKLDLLNIAVHPDWRSQFVGTAMLAKLRGKLSDERRNRITADVHESNVAALNWFKSQGFRLADVTFGAYDDCNDDCYTMSYKLRPLAFLPESRIGKLGKIDA